MVIGIDGKVVRYPHQVEVIFHVAKVGIIVGEVDALEENFYLVEANQVGLGEGDDSEVVVEDGLVPGLSGRHAEVAAEIVLF